MIGAMTPEELARLAELLKRVTEQNQRKASNAAALREAREKIEEQGRFIPKVDQPKPIKICF